MAGRPNSTMVASATGKAPPQAGVFEGLNPAKYNPNNPIILFIIQAVIILVITRLLHWPLGKLRQPPVIAEMVTGIILGPSILGHIPHFTETIFPEQSMPVFSLAANIGLILYLFLVGLEIDLRFLVKHWRTAVTVASLDMCVPFGMGYAIAYGIFRDFAGEAGTVSVSFSIFGLFAAVAISITAFPVLCRLLTSLNLLHTRVGIVALASGIANDVAGWVLLALVVTLVNAENGIKSLWILLVSTGYAIFLAFPVRPVFIWVLRTSHSLDRGPSQPVVALTIFMVLISAFFTSIIGVHPIFGAFMIGLICPHEGGFAIKLTEKIEDLVATLFLPLYFAGAGLGTDLGLLNSGMTWAYVIGLIVVAFVSNTLGGAIGARLNGLLWREATTIGVLTSCKGLEELIVLNIGLQANILSTRTFTMFVVMALITTFMTTPIVSMLYPPAYQRKVDLWVQGKIDWDGKAVQPEETIGVEVGKSTNVAGRILVYLRADGLSTICSLINLFPGIAIPTTPSDAGKNSESEKGGFTTTLRTSIEHSLSVEQVTRRRLRIYSVRLSELSERNSSRMSVSGRATVSVSSDPTIRAFGLLAQSCSIRDVIISAQIAVVHGQRFAETLTSKAASTQSDLMLVPWSETGSLSELPGYSAGSSVAQDPFANRAFAKFTEDLFISAKTVAHIGVFIDKTILASSPSAPSTSYGVDRVDDDHDITFSSGMENTHIHVLYSSTPDDLFAVRLAIHLAQNPNIFLTITKLSIPASLYDEDAHVHDTAFADLKAHAVTLAKNHVTFLNIEAMSVSDELLRRACGARDLIFMVGRSVSGSSSVGLSRLLSGWSRTMGACASDLVSGIKKLGLSASVLVVQAREEGTGSGRPKT